MGLGALGGAGGVGGSAKDGAPHEGPLRANDVLAGSPDCRRSDSGVALLGVPAGGL